MKILHLTTWKQRCGIADFAENLVSHLALLGVENEVFAIDLPRTRYMTTSEFRNELDRGIAKAAGCDLVHVQHEFSLLAGSGGLEDSIGHFSHLLSGLRAMRRPVAVSFHTEPTFSTLMTVRDPGTDGKCGGAATLEWLIRKTRLRHRAARLQRLWQKQVAPFFAGDTGSFRALVPTPRMRLGLLNSGCARDSVTLRPHGIAERGDSYHAIGRDAAKLRLGLPADSVLLTIFGFVAAYKGHALAVDALKKLPANYYLAVMGGTSPIDPSDLTLDSVLASWQDEAPQRLHVTGYAPRETIDLYHAATDICLAPFRTEFHSGSASIGWALSSGKPIIATNIPAFAEMQREGDCLLMCTPNCVHELAWNIRRLAGDRQLQHKLAQNALGYAQRHNWRQVSRALRDMYCELIGDAQSNDAARAANVVSRKAA